MAEHQVSHSVSDPTDADRSTPDAHRLIDRLQRCAAESLRSEHLEDVVSWTDGGPPAAGDDNQRVEAS